MKTTLFKALDAADTITMDGYEVVEVSCGDFLGLGLPQYRLILANDDEYSFLDQEVTLDDGIVVAQESPAPGYPPFTCHIELFVSRPLTPADLED